MKRLTVDLSWMAAGSCTDLPDLPWTADAWDVCPAETATMARVCAGCPVLVACDVFAGTAFVTAGFWAGKDRDPDHGRTTKRREAAGAVAS